MKLISLFTSPVLLALAILWIIGGKTMEIEKQLNISASQDKVWKLLTDSEEIKKWNPEIIEDTPLTEETLQKGAQSKLLMKEGSGQAEYLTEIIEVVTNEKLDMSLSGGPLGQSPMFISYIIKNNDNNSVAMTFKSSWKPKEFWLRVMSPLIKMMAQSNTDQSMSRLKELAEKN